MSMKKIIGNLDIEIEFRSNEKNFENVKNKIFSFLSKNFFKDPKIGREILKGICYWDFNDGNGTIKYYDLELSFFENFLEDEVEEISQKIKFKDFEFYLTFRYDMYNIEDNTISIGNNDHIFFNRNGSSKEEYLKDYKNLSNILKRIESGEHIQTCFPLQTLKYFNNIYQYNQEKKNNLV